jgi:hypothetical protein
MITFLKKTAPYALIVLLFMVVSGVYMSPAFDGKRIATSDGVQGRAAVQESAQYRQETGNMTWWTGSMFCGMPNYQIGGASYQSSLWLRPFHRVLLAGYQFVPAIVLLYCLAYFLLLAAMGVNKWLAAAGGLAIAFSSYFFIIIGANHHSKTSTLALMAVVLAAFYMIYHGRRAWGIVLTMIASAVGLYPHPQMAYYMCFLIGFFFLAELWSHVQAKRMREFWISTLLFVVSFGIGAGTGTAATFANMEYASETMRGGHSDLVKDTDTTNRTQGLDLDYATAWSYGIDETWTFLVPNYMGGSSNYAVGKDSDLYREMTKRGVDRRASEQFCNSVPTYWGDQPFTAGPVYMGAAVCLLFVLGLCIVRGPYKWALLAATVLSVFLSWGHNWMGLTRLFFDYVPMYNKFRAVSSILVIAEVSMPLLAFLAIRQLMDGTVQQKQALRSLYVAGGVTGGLCLLLAVFGSSALTFISPNDEQMFAQLPDWLSDGIVAQRKAMFTSDCWRSLLFVALTFGLVWLYIKRRMKPILFGLVLCAIVLLDMWPVNKRYCNDSMFSSRRGFDQSFAMQPYEEQILQDKTPHFRVFNLATNTFNDARTSYRLKSIGGYSAAKLRRYQDLIDQHLSKMHMPVINMLNTKYVIVPGQQGGTQVQLNPDAMGNAWFVDSLVVVDNANAECDALNTLDLRTTAVLDRKFADKVPNLTPGADSTASVVLTKYTPEYIEYDATASKPGTIVFSEIYYPYGWKAYVDGQPVDHYRVNYVLRALNIEPGLHHIRFEFRPDSVAKGNLVSMIFVGLMYAIILALIVMGIVKWRKGCREGRAEA